MADDGVFFLNVAGNKFVGLGDGDAFDDARHGFERAEVDVCVMATCIRHGSCGVWGFPKKRA